MFSNLSVNIAYPDVSRQEIMEMRGETASVSHAVKDTRGMWGGRGRLGPCSIRIEK